jgi:hypothetical protein
MMSDRRVVRVRDFARLRDADEDVLIAYLANPSPSTVMIFTADDLDKRKKSTKALLDACTVVDFSPLKDSEAKAWARSYLKSLKSAGGRSGAEVRSSIWSALTFRRSPMNSTSLLRRRSTRDALQRNWSTN